MFGTIQDGAPSGDINSVNLRFTNSLKSGKLRELIVNPPMKRFDEDPFVQQKIADLSAEISDPAQLRSFLERKDIHKSNETRFLAWMTEFRFLPYGADGIILALYGLNAQYLQLAADKLGSHFEDPASALPPADGKLISEDIDRSASIFLTIAESLGISPGYFCFSRLQLIRVLALLSLSDPLYSFTQGYDRFVIYAYAISVYFAVQLGQTLEFGESLSFFLTQRLIQMSDVVGLLEHADLVGRHFCKLDLSIKERYPALAAVLKKNQQSSFYFALRWEILMFADEHTILDLFLLWDTLIVHRNQYAKYRTAMCLAHIAQVPVDDSPAIITKLLNHKDWDVIKILKDTDRIVTKQTVTTSEVVGAGVVALVGVVLVVQSLRVIYRRLR
jgi:hypothetical protein